MVNVVGAQGPGDVGHRWGLKAAETSGPAGAGWPDGVKMVAVAQDHSNDALDGAAQTVVGAP